MLLMPRPLLKDDALEADGEDDFLDILSRIEPMNLDIFGETRLLMCLRMKLDVCGRRRMAEDVCPGGGDLYVNGIL